MVGDAGRIVEMCSTHGSAEQQTRGDVEITLKTIQRRIGHRDFLASLGLKLRVRT